jgi:hypothetical protein
MIPGLPAPVFPIATRAFLVATITAALADVLLAAFTGAGAAALDQPPGPPWWVAAHVLERSRWVVLAAVGVVLARRLDAGRSGDAAGVDEPAVWRAIGMAVAAGPIAWFAAGWIVQAVLFTVAGRWDIDGRAYLAADYYRRLLAGYVPWLLAGATTIALGRHVR